MTRAPLEESALEPGQGDAQRTGAATTGGSLPASDAVAPGTEPAFDATWTERMLNSLAAWGRRERGLIRDAHSDARSYVAYDAQAGPLVRTAAGTVDQGTVEFSATDDETADAERAERAAPTVMLPRRRRRSRSAALALLLAFTALGAIGLRRAERPAASRKATAPPLSAVSIDRPPQPPRRAEGVVNSGTSNLPAPFAIEPVRESAEHKPGPQPQRLPPRTSPSSPVLGQAPPPRAFVDLVNRY